MSTNWRIFCVATASIGLAACAQSQAQRLETAALADATTMCIQRESREVATKPVDLDTAAMAVMAKCNSELWAEEKALRNRYAGHVEEVSEQFKRVRMARMEQAQKLIAMARVN